MSKSWLYQQILSTLTPVVTILNMRELELPYLTAAFDTDVPLQGATKGFVMRSHVG